MHTSPVGGIWCVEEMGAYHGQETGLTYGVATITRLLKIIGLFRRILSLLYGSFAKETYNFKEPTNRSETIVRLGLRPSAQDRYCARGLRGGATIRRRNRKK